MTDEEKDARLARAILRVIQREPDIRRTNLTIQIRPYGEDVFRVLDTLIKAGIVKEIPVVLRPDAEKNRRAALTYRLSDGMGEFPLFDDLDAKETAKYLNSLPQTA
jgi:hypothetical protein